MLPNVLSSSSTSKLELPIEGNHSPALIDVIALAKVVFAEARGEGIAGQIAVVDVVRNRCELSGRTIEQESRTGFCSGKLTHEFADLAADVLSRPSSHPFLFFLNPKRSTDCDWLAYSKTQRGLNIGQHFFF